MVLDVTPVVLFVVEVEISVKVDVVDVICVGVGVNSFVVGGLTSVTVVVEAVVVVVVEFSNCSFPDDTKSKIIVATTAATASTANTVTIFTTELENMATSRISCPLRVFFWTDYVERVKMIFYARIARRYLERC